MITVVYRKTFVRMYQRLPADLQLEVKEKIAMFKENPRTPSLRTHKLTGKMKGCQSFSVNYKYRIVFEEDVKGVYALLAVGDHDVYK